MFIRIILLSTLVLICTGTAMAQQPGPEFWRKVGCQPLEPRTNLERLEERYSAIIIKGFTRVESTVKSINVEAVELRDVAKPASSISMAKGIVISLEPNPALIDYEEIDPLLNAIDTLSRVDETATRLTNFEARYRTEGDFEITVFRQTRSGTAVRISAGLCNPTIVSLSLDELARLRAMIKEAKTRLDELR
jgi:hypothetical protein